jgi:HTH-type transcriptional regulator, transcriptional repressor of NAD biosynthesis genes
MSHTSLPDRRYATGLIVGRFNPPHLGHSFMIDWAAERCESLVVFVNTRNGEAVPGELRAQWLGDLHANVRVIEVRHDLDTNFDDEVLWAKWMDLFRQRWPLDTGPHAVFSSDGYVSEIARRFGVDSVSVDPERSTVPISATMIRDNPTDHLDRVAPAVREWIEANWLRADT